MKLNKDVLDELRVEPGKQAHLANRSTEQTKTDWMMDKGTKANQTAGKVDPGKRVAEKELASFVAELATAQNLLWADGSHALLIVLQALDAAGKDGTIKHVMSGVNPQGCRVESFRQPSTEELSHDFLWRCTKALPALGGISVFNRSYYEDVLVVRVHPELLDRNHEQPDDGDLAKLWKARYEDINNFEQHLHRNNTRIVKVFLHLSRDEQKKRFLKRLDDPDKRWKFSTNDLAEREHWDDYQIAYEEALSATSTPWAPWYVVPADHKYTLRALVGGIIVNAIDQMDLKPPRVAKDKLASLDQAKKDLLAEK
jgi:PPK2 family polyphosphate:nucleotide phosphotransferase